MLVEDSFFYITVAKTSPDLVRQSHPGAPQTFSVCLCIYSFIQQVFVEPVCIPDTVQDFKDIVKSKAAA